ncbi:E3 ubiquitin-protein ligase MBR1 [Camellia lanceoleosa]|uniref:E3 ubiquitin-protein ligase MBR1 n=1 Tax=Camellia lanceoleosa TaxID=1840588 RepID=A0ACC0IK32_9ERIC|nr:E3 ubiquitin-protein ligase MBR1 [Camellia lanceoleosa]
MQGQRSAGNSFPETVDLNQGFVSNNTGMNQSTAWNSMLSPVESQLPNYMLSFAEGNYTCTNAISHSARGFSGWDLGESSSSQNLQGQGIGDGMKIENGQSSSFLVLPGSGPSNIFLRDSVNNGIGGNQINDRPLIMQSSSSSRVSLNINLNAGDTGSSGDGGQDMEPDACHNLYKVSGPETEQILSANASSDNTGNSSCHSGTSGQSCPDGSSNCFQNAEIFPRHGAFARYSASSSLSISPPPVISPCIGPSEQLNPRSRISMRGVASEFFPPSSVTGIAESSSRIFGVRGNVGHHESVRFNLPSTGNVINHSDVCSPPQPSRPLSFIDSLDLRQTTIVAPNSNNPPNQSHSIHILDLPKNTPSFPCNGNLNSGAGGSSSSSSLQEEASFRSTPRNSMGHPMVVPPTEMRNSVQDSNNWNLSTGNTSTSTSVPSSSRISPSSAIRPFPTAWTPHRNPSTQNQQRLSEFSPWTLLPSETIMPSAANSQGHHPPYPRSALLELPGDDVNGWRALADDIEGRHRLVSEIRQVLNAMRRGENLRAEVQF